MKDIPFPLDREHSCENCIHHCGTYDHDLHRCECNEDIITFVHNSDGMFHRTWNKCDRYEVAKTCWNCGHYKKTTKIIVVGDMDMKKIQFICAKNNCPLPNTNECCINWKDGSDKEFREKRNG